MFLMGSATALLFTVAGPPARAGEPPTTPSRESSECIVCHAKPEIRTSVGGTPRPELFVPPQDLARSVHAELLCTSCHPPLSSMLHDVPRAEIDYRRVAIGTGPFILESFTRGGRYVYKRHPDYYERGKPYLDEIVIYILRDFATRAAGLRAGRIDVVDLLPWGQAQPIIKEGSLQWEKYQGIFSVHARLNTTKPPLDKEKVRQAMSVAINRLGIAIALGGGEGVVNGPVPTGIGKWAVDWRRLPFFQRDVTKAKALLREAGFPDGFTVEAVGGFSPDNRRIMLEAMKAQWAQIGITLNIRLVDPATVARLRFQRDFTILADNFTLSSDPDSYLFLEYYSKSSGNFGAYSDPEVDRVLETQRRELDPARRLVLVHEAQMRIGSKSWILTTGDPIYVSLAWPYVKGFRHNNINQYLPLKNVWLDR